MKLKRVYKNKQEEIKDKFDKYKRTSNTIYWTAILNVVSFILILFRENYTYSLGYAFNILTFGLLKDNFSVDLAISLSLISVLITSLIFFLLSFLVKKGKLIPLIITSFIYLIDTILLFFIEQKYFITDWNKTVSIFVHVFVVFYLAYMFYQYYHIVKLSMSNNTNK